MTHSVVRCGSTCLVAARWAKSVQLQTALRTLTGVSAGKTTRLESTMAPCFFSSWRSGPSSATSKETSSSGTSSSVPAMKLI